jgi:hypothetical protein
LSDTEVEKLYRDAGEMESFRAKALVHIGRLQALLVHLGITTAPRYRIKEVSRPGRVEFKVVIEIFSGSRLISRHQGSAFKVSPSDIVADNSWQAITSWDHSNMDEL